MSTNDAPLSATARRLRVPVQTLQRWCKEDRVPGAYQIEGSMIWMIPRTLKKSDIDVPVKGRPRKDDGR